MKKPHPLYSQYIIDGVKYNLSPAALLGGSETGGDFEPMVDETAEAGIGGLRFSSDKVDEYLELVRSGDGVLPLPFIESCIRGKIGSALLSALWLNGSFRLGDLSLQLDWKWNSGPLGSMAAFYLGVQAACEYADALSLRIASYKFSSTASASSFNVRVKPETHCEDDLISAGPFCTENPRIGRKRLPSDIFLPDPGSWIVYIPFDSSDYRLGGSLLARKTGAKGGVAPQIMDADYFLDCFEVVRELVEDGVVIAGEQVGEGGLIRTAGRMAAGGTGAVIDISDLMAAHPSADVVQALFAEVPGVLVQIKDMDFDYLDAELLLQDVAFYPLGHPVPGCDDVRVVSTAKSGIQSILESLISSQNAEGED